MLWQLAEIERDYVQRGLPVPSEEEVHAQCLRPGVEAPDLVMIKDFFRFYIATSCPRLADKSTADLIESIAKWFFTAFT